MKILNLRRLRLSTNIKLLLLSEFIKFVVEKGPLLVGQHTQNKARRRAAIVELSLWCGAIFKMALSSETVLILGGFVFGQILSCQNRR